MKKALRVAIVCDWLTGVGGAERVVLEIHRMFPDALIYTSQYDPVKIDWFKDAEVRTTWLQALPIALKKFLPILRAWAFSRLDLSGYDLIISSSGAEAKGVRTTKDQIHISYCHAPTHYYWSRYDDYMHDPGFGPLDWLARIGLKLLVGPMRSWDYKAAQRPDYLIANSTHTQAKIKEYYGRDSVVMHPPVDIERFEQRTENGERKAGFVVAGRQTPYKKIDLAVAAATKANVPLVVIGNGPDHKKLLHLAGPTITFLTNVSDSEIVEYFASAEAFIFPGVDDFGIVAVEAQAAGTPVIAYKAGGALDYIKPGVTGEFFDEQTVEALDDILKNFDSSRFDPAIIKKSAARFSSKTFRAKLNDYLQKITNQIQ
jgi:glycosyltransferase involved in cell wall biosynthesis